MPVAPYRAESRRIALDDGGAVSARLFRPREGRLGELPLFVYAHGAGVPMTHLFMRRTAEDLASRGVAVLTFNFPYTEAGRMPPDRAPVLMATWRAVWRTAGRMRPAARFAGGKSMGGRMASMCAADGSIAPAALVYFGYPLHPPNQPDKLRAEHLSDVAVPQLFLAGTRDPLCELPLLRRAVKRIPLARIETIRGGDHSFAVRKNDPLSQEAVFDRLADLTATFILATM